MRSRRWVGSSMVLSMGCCGWEVFLSIPFGALEEEAIVMAGRRSRERRVRSALRG